MKKNCNIIRDLLPLYVDNVCSNESRKLVKEHLEDCQECQEYAKNLKENVKEVKINEIKIIKDFAKKVNFKVIKRVILFVCIIVGIWIGALVFINNYEFYTEYDEKTDILLLGNNKKWNFQFVTPLLSRVRAIYMPYMDNGEKVNVIFINNRISLYNYLKADRNGRPGTGPDFDSESINLSDKMLVYYTTEDIKTIKKASEEELKNIISNSKLIFTNETTTSTINCTLNNQDYSYSLTYYALTGQILDSNGDDCMPDELLTDVYSKDGHQRKLWFPGFTKATDVFKETEKYMTSRGGVCTITDSE